MPAGWLEALLRDLRANAGACLVVADDIQPAEVHALAHGINAALGNVGSTVFYTAPVAAEPIDGTASLVELTAELQAGTVDTLLILAGNPVYTAPADVPFGDALAQAAFSVHLSLYEDETSARCQWHIPEAHFLEAWVDVRAFDGTVSLIQPLISPLYGGRTASQLLALAADQSTATAHDLLRGFWQQEFSGDDFEAFWRAVLSAGVVPGTTLPVRPVTLTIDWATLGDPQPVDESSVEIVFRLDPTLYDGRFANNGWLQELPQPITTLTWDNAALMSLAASQAWRLDEIPAWHYLTGDAKELRAAWISYHIGVLPGPPAVLHNAGVYVIDRAGQLRWYLSVPWEEPDTSPAYGPWPGLLLARIEELLAE